MGWLRAIRRGVFLERDGRPETGRVAWCWRPRSPLESLNGVLPHQRAGATSASPSRRSKGNCYTDYYTTAAVMSATRPAACRLGPLQVAMRGLEVSDSGICKRKTDRRPRTAALSTDAAGDEQEIGYIGLMSWK